jgi:hypothetical protein
MARLVCAVLLVVCLAPGHVSSAQELRGTWEGELLDPVRPVVMTLNLDEKAFSFSGSADSPIANLRDEAGAVAFEVTGRTMLRFEGRRVGNRITGTMTGPTRQLPFWLAPVPVPTKSPSRAHAWREDIDAVRRRFLSYDRSFAGGARANADRRLVRLAADVGDRTDPEIIVELSRIVALAGNAHTRLYFVRNRTEVRRLPIRVWWFQDDLRIVRATAAHRHLLGCRVRRIGGVDVGEALRRVRNIKAGNDSWQRYMSTYYLTSPDVLAGAHIIPAPDRVRLTVACPQRAADVTLEPLPLQRSTTGIEAWWDLAPSHPRVDAALVPALAVERASRYLARSHENYWFEYVPDLQTIYLQYNRAEPSSSEPMADFVRRLAAAIAERQPKAMMIDVRFNTGGNLDTGTPLVETISPLLKGAAVFVFTGRSTFSAGITHAAQWKQQGATIVGEPPGDGLDTWSEGGNFTLPHSGLTVHYANAFHRYSTVDYPDRKPYFFELAVSTLDPDERLEPAWEDYVAGRDVVFDAVARRIMRLF